MMNPRTHMTGRCDCRGGLQELRALDFAIQETVLYLDAYPHNQQALAYYHELVHKRCEVMAAYEQTHGPVTMYGNTNHNAWDWVEGPWPWEPDAN